MKPDVIWCGTAVMAPKVPSRGYSSFYREEKIVAHTTVKGFGKVAQAVRRARKVHPSR